VTGKDLRTKRLQAEIPAALLASVAKMDRSRLSGIERGYVEPSGDEQSRLVEALDKLATARRKVAAVAAEVGWPL
jgi:transcriptional regulator with XRE-family HTH domain